MDNTIGRRRGVPAARVIGMVAAGVLAGGVLAGALSAAAADSSSSSQGTAGYAATPGTSLGSSGTRPQSGGADPVRSDEKALSGSDAEKVRAAALKAVSGGTVYRVETDAGDGEYEAHMRKSDGTAVTVKLDKQFNVIRVEDGMGAGDPAPSGHGGNAGGSAGADA